MIVQAVKFRSGLPEEEVWKVAEQRAVEFRKLKGLVQKYYLKDTQTGEITGMYFWDSMESLKQFRESELARTIPEAYKVMGQPRVETSEVRLILRPEAGTPK